jgi:exosortase
MNFKRIIMERSSMILLLAESTVRNLWFLFFCILSVVLFGPALGNLVNLSFHDERYSHIILIPLISGSLVYLQKRRIFVESRYCPSVGMPLFLVGIILYGFVKGRAPAPDPNDDLSFIAFAMVLVWTAGFVVCYGTRAYHAAMFPLLFLLLIIPIPAIILDKIAFALQKGSAEMTDVLFRVAGIPVFRQGLRFSLPGIDIEIAKECSGIRSSSALLIAGMLAGQVFLQANWRKVCLSLCIVPIVIFKNALRIVTLSWLGVYVNRGFLYGRLHHSGGLLFALTALAIMLPILIVLQRSEARARSRRTKSGICHDGGTSSPARNDVESLLAAESVRKCQ